MFWNEMDWDLDVDISVKLESNVCHSSDDFQDKSSCFHGLVGDGKPWIAVQLELMDDQLTMNFLSVVLDSPMPRWTGRRAISKIHRNATQHFALGVRMENFG